MRSESIVNVSARTVTDCMNFCRGVCADACLAFDGEIGGVGKIVEIDESKYGKRKYNKGKRMEGEWFGGLVPVKVAAWLFLLPFLVPCLVSALVMVLPTLKQYVGSKLRDLGIKPAVVECHFFYALLQKFRRNQ
ncbi:hypothetical protein HNY73_002270 [Argiope bruennichi]|uniref:Uncharacterized protein n=1 Tax=Argiope bruennichi TaxID=94029 RepID=A0A8T0FZG2_ARGBR|nr:hypothetical protein HNY73_002270 [Argiope bruennichi]